LFNIAKLWLKIILGFTFSVFVMVLIVSYGFIGTVEPDTLEIVVTEATGLEQEEAMISANLNPYVIQNTLWLAVSILGFCLVFLYFLDMSLRSFLAPGFLSIVTVVFLQIISHIVQGYIPPEALATGHVFSTLERVNQISWIMVVVGIILMLISVFGQRALEDYRSRKYSVNTQST